MSKKILSILLALTLVVAGLATAAAAYAKPTAYNALDTDKKAAVDALQASTFNSAFNADDEVVIMVVLEDDSIIDVDLGGLSVASFIDSAKGVSLLSKLSAQHLSFKSAISKLANVSFDGQYDYYVISNGFSLKTTYSNIAAIRKLAGVKYAYVSGTYDVPDSEVVADPTMAYSTTMIGSDLANETGYTGAGVVVGILDTGLDLSHEAFVNAPKDPDMTSADLFFKVIRQFNATGTARKLYKSAKVPFAYDYADKDTDVTPGGSDHGVHVAGTVAGYALNADGTVKFSGVAPDAQLAIFKVFSDKGGGASDTVIQAALEDAVVLGVDVLNMSLGSAAGFSKSADEATAEVYAKVEAAGINLCVSAGNDYYAGYNTDYIGTAGIYWNSIPDIGLVGSPSTYAASLSVASIENTAYKMNVFTSNGANITYSDTAPTTSGSEAFAFTTLAANNGGVYEVVPVGGTGTADDFAGVDVKGKIALVIRGSISFQEKAQNAAAAGAVACIVYNNQPGTINMAIDPYTIPAASITAADGAALLANIAAGNNTITVLAEQVVMPNPDAYLMSDFSSFGASPTLDLKPEVTAPGGNIYSTLPNNTYGVYSGTSMAAPHIAGACAVLRQYVNEETSYTGEAAAEFINTLLMCTADIVTNEDGAYYSPRKQGSGLINLMDCINTAAIISVDGNERPKANLGSSEDGVYNFSFSVENLGSEDIVYALDANAQSNLGIGNAYFSYTYSVTDLNSCVTIVFTVNGEAADSVTVAAGETADVEVAISVTGNIPYLRYYPNGVYIEGFVQLTSEDAEDLVIPYLGFYGDYDALTIFDDTIYEGGGYIYSDGALVNLFQNGDSVSFYRLGYNFYDDTVDGDKIVYSPDMAKNAGKDVSSYLSSDLGLLANASNIVYTITNAETGETVVSYDYYFGGEETKSYYYANGGYVTSLTDYEAYAGIEETGRFDPTALAEGSYVYSITATNEAGTHTETISYIFAVDKTTPRLVSKVVDAEAQTITLVASDNTYIMGTDFYIFDSATAAYAFDANGLVTLVSSTDNEDGTCTLVYSFADLAEAGYNYGEVKFNVFDYALYGTGSYTADLDGEDTVIVSPDVDKTELQSALDEAAALNQSYYTRQTWSVLSSAVTAGKAVMADENATQEEVDNATAAINAAIAGLKLSLRGKFAAIFGR